MYIIVVGGGRTGSKVVELATQDGHQVVVVERDQAAAEKVNANYDCMVIEADAASKEILLEAGIEEAAALVSTTESDSVNLMISMFGRQYGVETLVSSINDPDHVDLFRDLGVSIAESPHELNGRFLYRAMKHPGVRDFMEVEGGAEILEVTVDDDAPTVGRSLTDAGSEGLLPEEAVVVSILRGGDLHVPSGRTEIRAGDTVTLFAKDEVSDRAVSAFTAR